MSWTERDARVLWHPYTQAELEPPPVAIVRGEGAWLEAEDGRRYLDAISSWWTCVHGHAHPRLVRALAEQAATLEHVIFAGVTICAGCIHRNCWRRACISLRCAIFRWMNCVTNTRLNWCPRVKRPPPGCAS